VVFLQPEEMEEVQAMSAFFEYLTLFDFFIIAALIAIFCCGLLDSETTR
jgi:hypothetical protein